MSGEPDRDRRSERRQATVDEILDQAWALARDAGLAGLSLRDLARAVGMRPQSLYSYFASKNAIYDAMYAEGQRQLIERMSSLPESGISREDVRVGVRTFFEFCTEDPVRYQLLFQRTIPGFVPSERSYALAVDALERVRRQLVDAGLRDPRHLDLWTAVMTGLTDQQISNDPGGDRWADLIDDAVDMLCDHVGIGVPPARTTKGRRR